MSSSTATLRARTTSATKQPPEQPSTSVIAPPSTTTSKAAAAEASTTSSSSISISNEHHQEQQPDTANSPATPLLQRPPSFSQRAISQTLTGTANLANLLPTGTLLAFQLLTPIFTNNGTCDAATRPMTAVLLAVLAVSCLVACFTDSVMATDGKVYYGIATFKGLYLFEAASVPSTSLPDLKVYRIEFIDWVHAVLSVLVFGAVALRDKNVVSCFYPKPGHEAQEVLDVVPIGIGLVSSLLFVVFPTRRHGIGFPVTPGK